IVSSTQINAVAPAESAGTVDVKVTTPGGTSATSSSDQFTFVTPVPAVTGLSISSGSTDGGTSVVITGSGLSGATSVMFGSVAATCFIVSSSTQITAVAPAEAAGTVDVTVTTAGGTSATSSSDQFSFAVPPPVVIGVTASSGPTGGGTTITITGHDLNG